MKKTYLKLTISLLLILQANLACGQQKEKAPEEEFKLESVELKPEIDFGDASSEFLTSKAWEALGKKDYEAVWAYTQKCIDLYQERARRQQNSLSGFPPAKKESAYKDLDNVGSCYFIRAESLMRQEKLAEARRIFQIVIDEFSYAQYWDPRGWFWKVAEKSQESIDKLDKKMRGEEAKEEEKPEPPTSTLTLFNPGTEKVIDYAKYGVFEGAGTKDYKYKTTDQAGLVVACGEGVYPSTSIWRKSPDYLALKGTERLKGNQWDFLYTKDLQANFYKWNMSSESPGIKQFYIGFVLERAGLIQQAVKAYYAIVVHFPGAVGWTYWNTPWYIGPVAINKVNYLLRHHPELGLRLEDAKITIENSFDNDVRNDAVICNPGRLVKASSDDLIPKRQNLKRLKVIAERGTGHVRLIQYENKHWQLLVDDEPFPVRAVTYTSTKVGQSPDEGSLGNWMEEDFNGNKRPDGPYDSWVDKNRNNFQDADELPVGDFQLMKDMGINSIRVYHHPEEANKKVLSDLYKDYGIMTIMGDFLGAYTVGSGATWYEGTDYANPEHRKSMLESVRKMVNKFKDEECILFWLLGNENNYGVANNAKASPVAYYKFVNQAAKLIHELDPIRPVALCNGDVVFLDIFVKECPEVDIFGANAYRGKEGFANFWQDVREVTDKAGIITEFGCGAYYVGEAQSVAEEAQGEYHRGNWEDIKYNMAGYGQGNSLGGIIFEWLDEWWKAYEPAQHDWRGQFYGPFPDGFMHEEWLGVCGQGDGSQSPFLRTLRDSYYTYQELWQEKGR